MTSIVDRWTAFYGELEDLCDEFSRDLPKVIAVSKTRSFDEVQEAIDLGIKDFGENYPSYLTEKAEQFPEQNWHFIGTLQRNKAEEVCEHATAIHSLGRKKLTRRLLYFDYSGDCFIQVNISGEESKSGTNYDKKEVKELYDYSVANGLNVVGLMTIGNYDWEPKRTAIEFDRFVSFGHDIGISKFSLGMSNDWQEAVKAGSTHLRIGTAIFGPRQY